MSQTYEKIIRTFAKTDKERYVKTKREEKSMEKNESILNIICEASTNDFQEEFLKQNPNTQLSKMIEIQEEISEKITENIKDKELHLQITNALNELIDLQTEEVELWKVECYKKGFLNAMKLVKETREKIDETKKDKTKNRNGFLEYCENDFCSYFELKARNNLSKNKDYMNAKNRIGQIKEKYPKVMGLLDEDKIEKLDSKEKQQLGIIRALEGEMDLIELMEAYKIGLKDGVNL